MGLWHRVKLSDIAHVNTTTYSLNDNWPFVNYLDTGNITENVITEIQHIDMTTGKLPSRARRLVKPNSIIYSNVRPCNKHFGIIKDAVENLVVSTGFTVIDVIPTKADADFIYFLLTQRDIIEHLQSLAEQSVSAYPSIKTSDLENLEINIPVDIEEQRLSSSILTAINEKISVNRQINDNLQYQAMILFKHYFIDNIALHDDWTEGNLLDIANYTNGLAMQKYRPTKGERGLPVLKIRELRQGFCDTDSELCSLHISDDYIIHDGDIVFSWSGSLMVDIWCGGTCGLNQHLFKVTSKSYNKWFY